MCLSNPLFLPLIYTIQSVSSSVQDFSFMKAEPSLMAWHYISSMANERGWDCVAQYSRVGISVLFFGGKCDRSCFIDFLGVVGCASSGGGDTFKRMTSVRVAPAPKTLEWDFSMMEPQGRGRVFSVFSC